MTWHEFLGQEFKDAELHILKDQFNKDGFYCQLKNSHEYRIGTMKGDKEYALIDVSRDRIMTYGHGTNLTPAEISLMTDKLKLVRATGLEDVIRDVTHASQLKSSTQPYISSN